MSVLITLAIGLSVVALCSYALDLRMAYIRPTLRKGIRSKGHRVFGYDPYNSLESWREWVNVMEVVYVDLKG
jgi:hypothetical protein